MGNVGGDIKQKLSLRDIQSQRHRFEQLILIDFRVKDFDINPKRNVKKFAKITFHHRLTEQFKNLMGISGYHSGHFDKK